MMIMDAEPGGEFAMPGLRLPAPVRVPDAAARLELDGTERAALASLVRACGSVVVADVTAELAAPAWDVEAPSVRTGTCACCGLRRQLVAYTSMGAADADLCFRCGSDRAQGMECTSKPRPVTMTFSDSDWDAPA
jgi:hypothetical protein